MGGKPPNLVTLSRRAVVMISGVWCSKGRGGGSEEREGKGPSTVPEMHGVLVWVPREVRESIVPIESENSLPGEGRALNGQRITVVGAV